MTDELQIPTIQRIHMKICKRQILETADPECYPSGAGSRDPKKDENEFMGPLKLKSHREHGQMKGEGVAQMTTILLISAI